MKGSMRICLGIVAATLLGCASEEQVNPLGSDGGAVIDAGPTDDGGTGGSGGAPDAGPPKRTVIQRNPYGNVAETENLLWDGDFEWYSPFSDQYGWLAGSSAATLDFAFTDVKLGPECRSGIRCAHLKKKKVIAGIAVASQGNKIEVSFWAHLASGACNKVSGVLTSFDGQSDPDVTIHAVGADPDADGWCHYDGVVDPRQGKPVLFIQNNSNGDVLVDDAVIKKVASTMSVKAYHGPPTAELAAELEAARASFRRLRGPHDPPPNAARRAYEQRRQP